MSRLKRRFSIGLPRNATCVISKQWGASIWRIIKPRLQNWRQSSAQTFTRPRHHYRREANDGETVCAKNCTVDRCRRTSLWCRLLLEEGRQRYTERRRLLYLHDAPVGAFEGTRQMSHLRDGSRARDEEGRRSEAVGITEQNQILQIDYDGG